MTRSTRFLAVVTIGFGLVLAAGPLAQPAFASTAASPDHTIAQAGVVTLADLPASAGFAPSSSKSSSDLPIGKVAEQVPGCKPMLAFLATSKKSKSKDESSKVEGPDFEAASGAHVSSTVSVYGTQAQATTTFAVLHGPVVSKCFPGLMKTAIEEAFKQEAKKLPKSQRALLSHIDVSVTNGTVDPVGDDRLGYRVAIEMAILPGTSFVIDMDFVRVGRAMGMYMFMNTGGPPPAASSVLPAATGRLTAAQA